jgi:hypothetical protein
MDNEYTVLPKDAYAVNENQEQNCSKLSLGRRYVTTSTATPNHPIVHIFDTPGGSSRDSPFVLYPVPSLCPSRREM